MIPTIVPREQIERRLDAATARAAVRAVFAASPATAASAPPPLHLDLGTGEVHVKAATDAVNAVGVVKIASAAYGSGGSGGGSDGAVVVFDTRGARIRAILLDGGWLTDLRTAAVSALCVEVLSRSARRVTIVGAGTQARFHVEALRDLDGEIEIVVAARRLRAAQDLVARFDGVEATDDLRGAVRSADVVVTLTPSRTPVLERDWVSGNALVVAVGADAPGKQELPTALLEAADILIGDSIEQCTALGESQHLAVERQDAMIPLADLVAGRRAASWNGLRICDLTGVGACDAAMAAGVLAAPTE